MMFWIRVSESPSLHVTSQPWLVGKCQGFYQSSVVLLSNWNSLELVYVENKDCIDGYTECKGTGLEAGTEKPSRTLAAVFCLSGFCVASRLPSSPFLFLLLSLFFCRMVTWLLPAHSSRWHGFQVTDIFVRQGKFVNRWTLISQWLNITKVYFFLHYWFSVGDRHTTISWCCHLNRWFQGCQQQSWRQGHFLTASAQKDTCSLFTTRLSKLLMWLLLHQRGRRTYLTVQVNSWDQFTFPEPLLVFL